MDRFNRQQIAPVAARQRKEANNGRLNDPQRQSEPLKNECKGVSKASNFKIWWILALILTEFLDINGKKNSKRRSSPSWRLMLQTYSLL